MHIAMYTSNSHIFTSGGSEIHVRELASALVSFGQQVSVFCNSRYATRKMFIRENGVNYLIWPRPRIGNTKNFVGEGLLRASQLIWNREMIKNLQDSGADIFHQHDFVSNYLTTQYLAHIKLPVVLTNHLGEYLMLKKYLPSLILQYLLRPYKHIIGPSRELTPDRLHLSTSTIPNGFNESIYKPNPIAREAKRRELSLRKDDIFVVVPRRWAPTKGVLYAARAARLLAKYRPEIKWAFLCQNSQEFASYKSKIWKALDGLPTVRTFDSQWPNELSQFFNAADVVLLPSLLEAVSIASLEAMACGTLILSTRVGGMAELLTNGSNGILIQKKNSQAIANVLEKISKDHKTYKRIAKNGRKLIAEEYRWKYVAERTLLIYESILRDCKKR